MDNKKNGIPKLRFPGFTGAWEQRKLGEISELNGRIGFRGYTVKDIVSKEDGGILTFSPTNIINNSLEVKGANTYITKEKYEESPEIKVDNGDILFVKTGSTLGKSALVSELMEPATINPQIVIIRSPKHLIQFLSVQFITNYVQKQITAAKIGGAVPTLTEREIKKFKFYIPNDLDETRKIGQFFSKLDSLITLHQRKLEHLQEQKKGLLQKMFPKNGETVPEVRFPGFTDAWEQRKLGEVTKKITKGTTPHDKSWSGPVNYVKTESIDSNNGNISVIANTSLEEHEGYLKRSQLKENDVLFSIVGTLGRVGVVKKKDLPANTNQQICIIRPFEENSFFLLNALKTNRVKSFIKSDATIGAQPSLSLWQIEGLRIPFPNLEEQQKISAFFVKLDSLIALHQRKLDHLELMKKGLLQQMFV